MVKISQTVITHPDLVGAIKTVGIIIVEAAGDFSWVVPGTRFDEGFCDELVRRGISLGDLVTRDLAEADATRVVAIISG